MISHFHTYMDGLLASHILRICILTYPMISIFMQKCIKNHYIKFISLKSDRFELSSGFVELGSSYADHRRAITILCMVFITWYLCVFVCCLLIATGFFFHNTWSKEWIGEEISCIDLTYQGIHIVTFVLSICCHSLRIHFWCF